MTNEFHELVRVRRLILILSCAVLAGLLLIWLFVPAKPFVMGIIIGGLISLYNVLYLARRVRIAGQLTMTHSVRPTGTGLINRILMIAFGVILAYRFPEWIDYRALVIGLPMSYVLMVVAMCLYINKETKMRREGRSWN